MNMISYNISAFGHLIHKILSNPLINSHISLTHVLWLHHLYIYMSRPHITLLALLSNLLLFSHLATSAFDMIQMSFVKSEAYS